MARSPAPAVSLLRIGHRPGRDPRLTTHLALAARAWGAERMYLHPSDPSVAARLNSVARQWGGKFEVVGAPDWKAVVRSFPDASVHLTMYGQPLSRILPKMASLDRLLVVVGGAKVPSDLYRLARWNVAVTHQPHSEVAAVAVLLDHLRGTPGPVRPGSASRVIVPQARGKKFAASRAR